MKYVRLRGARRIHILRDDTIREMLWPNIRGTTLCGIESGDYSAFYLAPEIGPGGTHWLKWCDICRKLAGIGTKPI